MMTPRADSFNDWAQDQGWPARCDPDLDFESPALRDILAIWYEQAGANAFPHRNKMTARVLKAHLGNICILERVIAEQPLWRVRLLGTRLAQILGEMQGKYLHEVIATDVIPHWHARLNVTLAEGRPVRFVSRVDMKHLYFLRSESFWAPLGTESGQPDIVLMSAILTFNSSMSAELAAQMSKIA